MISQRQLFLKHIAQPSSTPLLLEIEKAEGIYLYSKEGKRYIDLVSGVSVSNVGHCHPKVVKAVKDQVEKYMHLMVYGEYVQTPQVQYAKLLTENLPKKLDTVFFVNSGSEAIEGALKLAKRVTHRSEIIAFKNAYHGSTHGALSILGSEILKSSYRPLLPDIKFLEYNNAAQLESITNKTACVVSEPIQAEAGIIVPKDDFLLKLRNKCNETGSLLIFDEVQTGFGRTGSLFAFEQFNVIPDIMAIAKAMGGGMPIGAFVSSKEIMDTFKFKPALGHITTFGGHPVSSAAALASLNIILDEDLANEANRKGELFKKYLKHPAIKTIRGKGLFLAVELENAEKVLKLHKICIEKGLIFDMFLFCNNAFRIAPPLIITDEEIKNISDLLLQAIDEAINN
ncbi:MAG: aspartate aminotransferase family protein [Bacteroidetes bacterium]|nr:aspartate aminotransferase family protein [Bacteroidota bacterium]